MDSQIERPAAGSHDRSTPSGSLEESAANLFEAMLAARDAEERGERGPLEAFYRTLMSGTVLLPVPPEHGDEAKSALAAAVNDDEQVEISVMLAREGDGAPVSVMFGSFGALAAWAPANTGNLPLPARIAISNLAAAGLPAIMDPAGPVPYRFDADELAALAEGRIRPVRRREPGRCRAHARPWPARASMPPTSWRPARPTAARACCSDSWAGMERARRSTFPRGPMSSGWRSRS